MQTSSIEWCDATWNPTRGCSMDGPECANCYAMGIAHRFSGPGLHSDGLTKLSNTGPVWTGEVRTLSAKLGEPLSWRDGQRIFVNSMSDLFHDNVPVAFIADVFAVMWLSRRHTYMVLTKRAKRMRAVLSSPDFAAMVTAAVEGIFANRRGRGCDAENGEPRIVPSVVTSPNIWLGVSCGNKAKGKPRIEELRNTPAAVRFVSFEPLLEDLGELDLTGIHQAITGAESGNKARPYEEDWTRSIFRACERYGTARFYKQSRRDGRKVSLPILDGRQYVEFPPTPTA